MCIYVCVVCVCVLCVCAVCVCCVCAVCVLCVCVCARARVYVYVFSLCFHARESYWVAKSVQKLSLGQKLSLDKVLRE